MARGLQGGWLFRATDDVHEMMTAPIVNVPEISLKLLDQIIIQIDKLLQAIEDVNGSFLLDS